MKNLNNNLWSIVLLAIIILATASCDFLNVDTPSAVSNKDLWQNKQTVQQGMAGIYDAAQKFFGERYFYYGEQRSDDFSTYERPYTYLKEINTNQLTNRTDYTDWKPFYFAINAANAAIAKIPKVDDFKGKDDLLGQAYALRALFYFYGVRIWGKIPEVVKPINTNDILKGETKKRASVSKIFKDVIIPDLNNAEKLINKSGSPSHMNLGGVLALKAHVYMWPAGGQRSLTTALNAINELQGLNYKLVQTQSAWINQFRDGKQNGPETIFLLDWDFDEDGTNGSLNHLSTTNAEVQPSDVVRQKWSSLLPNDFRRFACFEPPSSSKIQSSQNWNTVDKYVGTSFTGADYETVTDRSNYLTSAGIGIIFYRLSGIILLKAEILNDMKRPHKALVLVNKIRDARGLKHVDENITNSREVRNMILAERQFELYAEGHRFWDLVRNGVALKTLREFKSKKVTVNVIKVRWSKTIKDSLHIYWPVAQNLLDKNPSIEQTKGY